MASRRWSIRARSVVNSRCHADAVQAANALGALHSPYHRLDGIGRQGDGKCATLGGPSATQMQSLQCRRSEAGRKNALYGLAVLKVGRTFIDKGVYAFTDIFGLEDFGEQVSLDL